MKNYNEKIIVTKQRPALLTGWLIILIVYYSIFAITLFIGAYFFSRDAHGNDKHMIVDLPILEGIAYIANIILLVLLLRWKKIGFWGLIITSVGVLIINLTNGIDINKDIINLVGITILYGILQIKKDNISAWENLK